MHPAQIKAALSVAGYRQTDAAKICGVAPTTVGAVIHGRSRSKQVEEWIAAITGHTLEELWPQWHGHVPLILSDDERTLILLCREVPLPARNQVLAAARDMVRDLVGNAPVRGASKVVIGGGANSRTAGRDYNENRSIQKKKS